MKKKRIAALAAAVIALQTMSAVVSAVPYGTYYYVNGVYFTDPFDAQAAGHGYMYTSTTNVPSNVVAVYYSSNTGKYYNSESAAVADGGSDYTVAYRAPDANIAVVGTTYYNWSNAYSSASSPSSRVNLNPPSPARHFLPVAVSSEPMKRHTAATEEESRSLSIETRAPFTQNEPSERFTEAGIGMTLKF